MRVSFGATLCINKWSGTDSWKRKNNGWRFYLKHRIQTNFKTKLFYDKCAITSSFSQLCSQKTTLCRFVGIPGVLFCNANPVHKVLRVIFIGFRPFELCASTSSAMLSVINQQIAYMLVRNLNDNCIQRKELVWLNKATILAPKEISPRFKML